MNEKSVDFLRKDVEIILRLQLARRLARSQQTVFSNPVATTTDLGLAEKRLTLFKRVLHIGLDVWLLFEQGSKPHSGELGRSLATVAVEDCKAGIVGSSLEIFVDQKLHRRN